MIANTPLDAWKTYLKWQLIHDAAPALSKTFEDENFRFFGKVLLGRKEQFPRWRRCVSLTDSLVGFALGKLYVEKYFPPEARQRVNAMIDNLSNALRANISSEQWMSPDTRARAIEKLAAYKRKIGYPDRWRDYSTLRLAEPTLVGNFFDASGFLQRLSLQKIGKPLDRSEWFETPPTVDAYNSPQTVEIVFPAGILQPPLFDAKADDAFNYGGMGAVIGHELIHGFDDEGRKFDAKGNMTDWWTADDAKQFDELAKCIEEQFGTYEVAGGVKTNGKLVLGESIADLGGLKIAFKAYQSAYAGKPRQIIDGLTPEQRFFLGWARIWATNSTPEAERLQAQTNPHPIARFRVNGPLSNMPEFTSAYGCSGADTMVSAKRCGVW